MEHEFKELVMKNAFYSDEENKTITGDIEHEKFGVIPYTATTNTDDELCLAIYEMTKKEGKVKKFKKVLDT